jgi:rfaE bifunctional protein nucleotidyltransferase chain/domain
MKKSTMSANDVYPKIKSLDELSDIILALKKDGKTIVQCHGVFDLLHPGHILHFQAAKREGDILVVTVTKDEYVDKGPGRPVFNQRIRTESIAAIQCVDYVALNGWPTAVETIKKLKPDVYVKGSEYAKADMGSHGKSLTLQPLNRLDLCHSTQVPDWVVTACP